MQKVEEAKIIAALDHAPLGRRHYALLAALLAALAFDYMKPATLAFVIPGMRQMWGLSPGQAAWLPIAGLSGTVLGALAWGFIADRIGRRGALLWTVGLFTAMSFCGLSIHYWHSLVACFLMGFGVGGEVPLVFALASEYVPVKHRARSLLFLGIVGTIGGLTLAAGVSAIIKAYYAEMVAWRLLWLIGIVPGLLILVLRSRIVPESARYHLAHGRVKEARECAESMIGPIEAVPIPPETKPLPKVSSAPSRLYARTAGLSIFSFAWGLSYFGLVTWLPTLLAGAGYAAWKSSATLALSTLVTLPAVIVTAYLFHRWSTQRTLVLYAAGAAATLLLLGWQTSKGLYSPAFVIPTISIAFFFLASIGGAFSLYAAEVYPTQIRAERSGIISAAGKLGGVVGLGPVALWIGANVVTRSGAPSQPSLLGLLAPMSALLAAAAVLLYFAGVETRNRTLEEITGT